ncbi:undecaprenyl diphosphate synthase family protein [Hathewaya limosa]|uniref:Undecaprenyl diphosphate synthase n=1 Tax=Hathewaya limosa TaxID=1536 RepID=A0ABU0JQL4_HATLI|nr:undecaprenyl diphosphate synthase family protein [Hathewaya limosa]MDQ0479387.1 undecaprenyl diphosphate synthase [Hathewaya limosa]
MRIPRHVGIIPDGNRRWAVTQGIKKSEGYDNGLKPGLEALRILQDAGVEEVTYYGFTTDNTKRPREQREAFTKACIDAVKLISYESASLLVVGDKESPMFPKELIPFTKRVNFKDGGIKVNFLVNYGWNWDLYSLNEGSFTNRKEIYDNIKSNEISRIDLIIRWGGRRRLSGFLPVQSVYSDFYIIDELWPEFKPEHIYEALNWYNTQDVTLGG